jgi:crotonobetainyl-CoA:carnitine CoA-transferase CaiB-like acyl-CoA transferase
VIADNSLPGPLKGLRVVELADRTGQWCGKLMADFGADVIKVEPPGGVAERQIGPFYQDIPHPDRSLYFWHYNTSKRSVTLDLQQEAGRELFRRMVADADVLLETTAPGTLPALGLTYEVLSADNPGLVMCSLTSFGQDGPWRDYLGTDMVQLAGGGQMAACGYDVEDDPEQRPIAPGGGNGWHMGSHYAYIAITAALFHRNMTGEGQYLDVSAHEAAALTTEMHVPQWIYTGQVVQRQTGRHAGVRPTPLTQLPTADGRYVNGGAGQLQPNRWKPFVEWMASKGMADDLTDPKYLEPAVFQENQQRIAQKIREFVGTLSADEAMTGAQELAGMPWGAVRAPDDLLDDDHFAARGFFPSVEHPELGKSFTYPGAAAIYPRSPWRIYRRAPLLGEDTADVLAEVGVDAAALAQLRAGGIV